MQARSAKPSTATENGARGKRATGEGDGKVWEVFEKNTKNTKDHEGSQRLPEWEKPQNGNRRCFFASLERPSVVHRLKQILGRLPPAGLPVWIYHKEHKGPQRTQRGKPSTARDTVQARSAKPSTAKEGDAGAGRACARRTSGPGACRGMAGFALGLGVFRWSPAGLIFHERPSVTLSPRRGALFSVAVEGLRLRRYTLRSLFSGARQRPLSYMSYRAA